MPASRDRAVLALERMRATIAEMRAELHAADEIAAGLPDGAPEKAANREIMAAFRKVEDGMPAAEAAIKAFIAKLPPDA